MPKVWFITGSSRGLGRALVEYALAAGDLVVATARSTTSLEPLLSQYPSTLLLHDLDVTDISAADAAISAALAKFGQIDVLVNNAGYSNIAPVETITHEDFRRQIDTNLFGVVNVTKAALPHMRARGSGYIFQVSSIGARIAFPGTSAYQAAKWAVSSFSSVLAAEMRPLGVKVTCLEPGAMQTDFVSESMTVHDFPEVYEQTVGPILAYVNSLKGEGSVKAAGGTDIKKVGKIIDALFVADDPPVRLVLGESAVQAAEQAAEALAVSDAKWRDLSVSTYV
ncbi:dehydrogenase/reductase SDR family member [Plectosphaerella plurivora]|uniref:Dehydrogenase/reductase SDR family member n=1 Tax=Plectosphaerella plurivora TaxID=936078 RepID=A0A9P8VKG0_9PEZI|nr:dehydrogenase/reductase SDR family member [Plectosphaerella plurivora]